MFSKALKLCVLSFVASTCGFVLATGVAFAECPHVSGNASPVIDRSDLRRTLSQCANESGRLTEHRQMLACNALVRYACTPLNGRILSTDDRQILVWAYSVRASALLNLGRTDEALADLNDALLLDANNVQTLTNRCRIRAASNRELDLALADCDAALRADANAAEALDSRGLAHLRRDDFEAARADFDAAIQHAPGSASALYGRAVANARLGRAEQAQADIAAAISVDEGIDDWFAAIGLTP